MIETRFKQTEIGLVPADWEVVHIKEIAAINTGSKNTEDKSDNGKYPFYVRSQKVEKSDSYSYDCEAVLTAGDGVGTGKVFHYINGKFEAHQRVYIINNFDTTIDGRYFYNIFSNSFYERVHSMTAKSSVDSVRKEMIADMAIAIPPIPEQQKIAEALGDMDALIAEQDKLIAKKRLIKQGTMQQLLTGRTRLKGFNEPWKTVSIGSDTYVKARIGWQGLTTNEYLDDGKYHLVGGIDFKEGKVDWKHCFYISEWRFKQDTNIQLKAGDVLISKDGTIGKVAYINVLPKPATLNSGVFVIRSKKENFRQEYLALVFLSPLFQDFMNELVAGSTIQHLYQKDIVKFSFSVPSTTSEQQAIAAILTDMDNEISELEKKKAKYERLKQGMMQQLLTGRIRLV